MTSAPSSQLQTHYNKGLLLFSSLLTGLIVCLILVGAQVTSTNSGLSVPDWPTSYGYNMFAFPFERWLGPRFWTNPIFWEHSHRLFASLTGTLTLVLAVWIWMVDRRPWLRWVATAAVGLVILQGVVGGLRVVFKWNDFGIPHAAMAQLFLLTIGFIALTYTRGWNRLPRHAERLPRQWQRGIHIVLGLIFLQLILGATMRHQHHGLAIPDFPAAYRHLWPHITPERLDEINAGRLLDGQPATSILEIHLQLIHRFMALVIFIGIFTCSLAIFRCRQSPPRLRNLAILWLALVSLQVCLGAATIWTGKNPVVTSAHVVTGALLFLVGSHMAALVSRWRRAAVTGALAPQPVLS